MKKLLVISGPTAIGKTPLALHLAKVLASDPKGSPRARGSSEPVAGPAGEVVSADSRQVYKGMDIGTGKDLPKNSKLKTKNSKLGGYYNIKGVKIWGYDLVEPKEGFSVAQYAETANRIIENIWRRKKLPILAGGAGLYIKALVDGIPTVAIPKNEGLRSSLGGREIKELYDILAQLDPIRAASMNASDRKNPRRLIRAIEVADYKVRAKDITRNSGGSQDFDDLFIGLKAPKKILDARIEKRVERRVRQGIEKEIESLLAKGASWGMQSMTCLGYRQWKYFFEGKKTKEEVVSLWKKEEVSYAKRQITWFKRDKRINWFDITKSDYPKNVEKLVKKWYSSM